MYAKFSHLVDQNGAPIRNVILKQHHHVRIDGEFKADCKIWEQFLQSQEIFTRPMVDFEDFQNNAELIDFYTDASQGETKGFGCFYSDQWTFGPWKPGFIKNYEPSIAYLELFILCIRVFVWQEQLSNTRVIVHCDNQAVVEIVNSQMSSCKQSMVLLRLLTLNNLKFNRRLFAQYITTKDNYLSDALSQLQIIKFFQLAARDGREVRI